MVDYPTITSLSLHSVGLDSPSLRLLGETLMTGKVFGQLRHLDIGGERNKVMSDPCAVLCMALQRVGTLVSVDFSELLHLDYFAVTAIGQLVRQNTCLLELSVKGIPLSPPAAKLLLSATDARRRTGFPVRISGLSGEVKGGIDH